MNGTVSGPCPVARSGVCGSEHRSVLPESVYVWWRTTNS